MGGASYLEKSWHEEVVTGVVAAVDVAAEARLREMARSRRLWHVLSPHTTSSHRICDLA